MDDAAKRPRTDGSYPGSNISDLLGVTADDVRKENAANRGGGSAAAAPVRKEPTPDPESQARAASQVVGDDDDEEDGETQQGPAEALPKRDPMAKEERMKRQEEDAKRYLVAQVRLSSVLWQCDLERKHRRNPSSSLPTRPGST